jgi:hypothetical protein
VAFRRTGGAHCTKQCVSVSSKLEPRSDQQQYRVERNEKQNRLERTEEEVRRRTQQGPALQAAPPVVGARVKGRRRLAKGGNPNLRTARGVREPPARAGAGRRSGAPPRMAHEAGRLLGREELNGAVRDEIGRRDGDGLRAGSKKQKLA